MSNSSSFIKSVSFGLGIGGLISFLFEESEMSMEYEGLLITVKFLCTLFHGQTAVERGSSLNKEVLVLDLHEISMTAI